MLRLVLGVTVWLTVRRTVMVHSKLCIGKTLNSFSELGRELNAFEQRIFVQLNVVSSSGGVGDGVMTMIRMSVATVTASLASEISLCAVRVYNHHLGRHNWRCNSSVNLLNRLQRHWCCKMESLTQKIQGTGIWRNQLCLYSWKEEIQVKVKVNKSKSTGKHPKQV